MENRRWGGKKSRVTNITGRWQWEKTLKESYGLGEKVIKEGRGNKEDEEQHHRSRVREVQRREGKWNETWRLIKDTRRGIIKWNSGEEMYRWQREKRRVKWVKWEQMHVRERKVLGVTIPPSLREPLAVSASDFCPFLLLSQLDASKCETCLSLSRRSFSLLLYSNTHLFCAFACMNTWDTTVSSLPINLSFPFLSWVHVQVICWAWSLTN